MKRHPFPSLAPLDTIVGAWVMQFAELKSAARSLQYNEVQASYTPQPAEREFFDLVIKLKGCWNEYSNTKKSLEALEAVPFSWFEPLAWVDLSVACQRHDQHLARLQALLPEVLLTYVAALPRLANNIFLRRYLPFGADAFRERANVA